MGDGNVETYWPRERRRLVLVPSERLSTDRTVAPPATGVVDGVVDDVGRAGAVVGEAGMAGRERGLALPHDRPVVEAPPLLGVHRVGLTVDAHEREAVVVGPRAGRRVDEEGDVGGRTTRSSSWFVVFFPRASRFISRILFL